MNGMPHEDTLVKVGLFGGTFNPIHTAHIIIAEWIRSELNLDTVYFMPTALPPHKCNDQSIVDIKMRKEMVRLAIQDNPHFQLAEYETDPRNVSYSVDTVRTFLKNNSLSSSELYFIIGEDNLHQLSTWKEPVGLSHLCRIVVARRPVDLPVAIPEGMAPLIHLKTPQIDISASEIRERIGNNQSIRYMVPESVERYIREHKLYGADNG